VRCLTSVSAGADSSGEERAVHRTFFEFVAALVEAHRPERTELGRRTVEGRALWNVRCRVCDPHRWEQWAEGDPAIECLLWRESRLRGLVVEPSSDPVDPPSLSEKPGCSACSFSGVCGCTISPTTPKGWC
jgi:hypothetical protein